MKKMYLLAIVALISLCASAKNYVVWSGDALTEDEEMIPSNYYGWWNVNLSPVDDAASPEGKALKWTSADGKGWAFSGGYHTAGYDLSPLADCDLVFEAKVEGKADYVVRLTGVGVPDTDYGFNIPADGKYHRVRMNIMQCFGAIYAPWKDSADTESSRNGYVFAIVAKEGASADAAVYVANVHYEATPALPLLFENGVTVTKNSATIEIEMAPNNPLMAEMESMEDFESMTVKLFVDGVETEFDDPAEPMVTINGLEPNTEYIVSIVMEIGFDGKTFTSDELFVKFRTEIDTEANYMTAGYAYGWIDNALLKGSAADALRRSVVLGMPYILDYVNGTLSIQAAYDGLNVPIEGAALRVCVAGKYYDMPYDEDLEFNVASVEGLEVGATPEIFFYLPYNGGAFRYDVKGYSVGDDPGEEANMAELTVEAQKIVASATTNLLTIGTPVFIKAAVADNRGRFVAGAEQNLAYTIDGPATVADGFLTATAGGTITVTPYLPDLDLPTETLSFTAIKGANISLGMLPEGDAQDEGNLRAAVDGNEDSICYWNCASTQEHWLLLDFGKVMDLELISLVWEGASAVDYTITVSEDRPETGAASAPVASDVEPTVFTVTNGEGGGGVTVRKSFKNEDGTPIVGRYLYLHSTRVFDAGWGMKLRDMAVYGSEHSLSGVQAIDAAAQSEAVYYNLQGQRVLNPAQGLYIRVQGGKATKVVL